MNTHSHFVGSFYVKHHVLDKGDLVQVWDDTQACVIQLHTRSVTRAQRGFVVKQWLHVRVPEAVISASISR